jgi:hypothetical protein
MNIQYIQQTQNWQNLPSHVTLLRGLKPRSFILKLADAQLKHFPDVPEFMQSELTAIDGRVINELLTVITPGQLESVLEDASTSAPLSVRKQKKSVIPPEAEGTGPVVSAVEPKKKEPRNKNTPK